MTLRRMVIRYGRATGAQDGGGGGGIFFLDNGSRTAWLCSTIIAGNVAVAPSTNHDCYDAFDSGTFSLMESTGNEPHRCIVEGITTGMRYNIAPEFGNVTGMDAARVYPLTTRSPAVDGGRCVAAVGNAPMTDQRGYLMPVDGDEDDFPECDMGASEYNCFLLADDVIFANEFEP